MFFESQEQNLKLNDQGGQHDVPLVCCGKFGWAITEMGPLSFSRKCKYWWNACWQFFTMLCTILVSWQRKTIWLLKTNKKLKFMTKEAMRFPLEVVASLAVLLSREGATCSCQQMWILVECWPFFHASSFMTKKTNVLWKWSKPQT